jgi:hypothetical protein
MTEVEALPSDKVLLSLPSQVLWPPPTPLSRISRAFGGRLIPSITWSVTPRRVEVSTVPLSSIHTSHSLYPEFLPWLRIVRSSTRVRGLRPHSKDSAEPPYTALSQHICAAEVYEAYEIHLRYGLYACARPRSGSGATFIRRCFRASVAIHAYVIATQATNQLL